MAHHMTRSWLAIVLVAMVLTVSAACSKKAYIYVDYQLPPVTGSVTGQTVFVQTHDNRNSKDVFNHRAQKAFEDFTGLYSLSLVKSDDERTLKGAYDLPMLFEEAFKERLKSLGVAIADEQTAGTPTFKIDLNQFKINLVGQKWIANIGYEASIIRDGQILSREVVTGSAERLKLVGTGGAEKIIGEIFTEMVNQLNVSRLFQQANL